MKKHDNFDEKFQELLDDLRRKLGSEIGKDAKKIEQEEQTIEKKEVKQEKKIENVDPCSEAVIASQEYLEFAIQIEILARFGDFPEELYKEMNALDERLKELSSKCNDEDKLKTVENNVETAEKHVDRAKSMKNDHSNIEELLKTLEKV